MSKIVTFNPEARERMIKGVNILGDAVGTTLGPKGRNVVIDVYGVPAVTKDGVTVAKSIELDEPVENLGVSIIKQAAKKTSDVAGDGTTTSTILAQALVNNANKLIEEGISPIEIKRTFESLLTLAVEDIKKESTEVNDEDIFNIASISANNDEYIGNLIADAFKQVGREGVLTVDDSKSIDTYIRVVDGVAFDKGYMSNYFITDPEKLICEYENVRVLVTDKKIQSANDIVGIMSECYKTNTPLLIIADEIEPHALHLMVINRLRSNVPVVAVKAPAYGERRYELLKDLAVITGAELITDAKGHLLKDTKMEQLGKVTKVIITSNETNLINPKGDRDAIEKRATQVKAALAEADNDYLKEKLTERLAKLIAKVAVIYIGAATETEVKEKKDRVDDAIRATRAALESGYVAGGGTTLFKIATRLSEDFEGNIFNAFFDALRAPHIKILENANLLDQFSINIGENDISAINALDGSLCYMKESGIIDPTLVLTEALTNAVSAANMIILSEVTVHNIKPKYEPMDPADFQG